MVDAQIVSLSERPEFIDSCAAWSYGEWGSQMQGRSLDDVLRDYQQSLELPGQLPETWIAVHEGKPVAMARLKNQDHRDRADLSPWLGTVFTHPLYRRMGIARILCEHVHAAARTMGFRSVYLFTGSAEPMYQKLGYSRIGTVEDTTGYYKNGQALMMKPL